MEAGMSAMTASRAIAIVLLITVLTPLRGFAREVKFARVTLEAEKSIAFVCDGSRWQKDKIDDLADQLNATVQSLASDQQFSIVFFADDKVFGPGDGRPMPATEANKQAARSWLRRVRLGREPTPLAGMARAFEGKPDTIVFITDGEFRNFDGVIQRVAALNRDKAVNVHTIGFFATAKQDDSKSFAVFMKKLAEDNGGQFHAVYADELKHVPK
jgi:hypothetical protein